jgi:hypothetical protein
MKAVIGPYRDRISGPLKLQDWYFAKRFGVVGYDYSEKDYTWYDRVVEKVTDAMMDVLNKTINKYLDKNERIIKIHIDDYDVWGADHTIALVVHPILLKLKSKKHGSPHVDDEDVPEHLRSTAAPPKENEWDTDDNLHARWDWVIDEMIWAFEQCAKDDKGDEQFYSGEVDWKFDKEEDSELYHMGYGPKHTFTVDREAKKAHYDRIQNGLRLFAKYYFGLWD